MVSEPSKSTGVTFPYEKQAMNGDEMPNGLQYYDQLMYQQLRLLYDQYRKGVITRETAQSEKKKFLHEYECYKIQWEMVDEISEMIRRTELARAEYRKTRTLENADRLCAIIEGRKNENYT